MLYKLNIFQVFQNKFDLDYELPLVFIDTHFNKSNPEEAEAFKRESDILWKVSMNKKPFQCLTRKDVQDKLVSTNSLIEFSRLLCKWVSNLILKIFFQAREKQEAVEMKRKCRLTNKKNQEMSVTIRTQEKQITAQKFVMNNLRNGIDYLKEHCKRDAADSK